MAPKLESLAYEICNESWDRIAMGHKKVYSHFYVFLSLISKAVWYFNKKEDLISTKSIGKELLFFIGSKHQDQACLEVRSHLKGYHILSLMEIYDLVRWEQVRKKSVKYIPLIIYHLAVSKGFRSRAIRAFYSRILLGYGFYEYFLDLFSEQKFSLVVMTNDHTIENRAILLAAKEMKVKIAYLQHASVTEGFPQLQFDYAFLDGKDALSKYDKKGGSTITYLVGINKFDIHITSKKKYNKSIGVCINDLEDRDIFNDLITALEVKFHDYNLILRVHPIAMRVLDLYRFDNERWDVSGPETESAVDFILRSDLIISDISNILLEAAHLKTFPIYFCTNFQYRDAYGFVKNGLLKEDFVEVKEVINCILQQNHIEEGQKAFSRCKYYNASIGTDFEGKTSILIAKLIAEIESQGQVTSLAKWKRLSTALPAYELLESSSHLN